MSNPRALQWIREGYNMVSKNGTNSINIESIARTINKNKSSFYHYFGDIKIFETELLDFHIQQVEIFSNSIKDCERIRPDVLNVFIEYKTDLLFHKQLRISRDNPEHKKCFEKAFKKVEEAFIDKWANFLGLDKQKLFAATFLHLIAENFLLQITEQGFDYDWLNRYLENVYTVLKQMDPKPKM